MNSPRDESSKIHLKILTPSSVTQNRYNTNRPDMLGVTVYKLGHAVAYSVKATSRKVAGSIPDGVIGIFH
jgi:hypothetical protein